MVLQNPRHLRMETPGISQIEDLARILPQELLASLEEAAYKEKGNPEWGDLFALIKLAGSQKREYGLKARVANGVPTKTFCQGEGTSIHAPKEGSYEDYEGKSVFIHVHPEGASENEGPIESASIFPSPSDILMTELNVQVGGYLNSINRQGATFCIGAEPITTATGIAKEGSKIQFTIQNDQGGRTTIETFNELLELLRENPTLNTPNSCVLFSVTDPIYKRTLYFLRVGWNKILDSKISLEDVIFKDGVKSLLEYLDISGTPHMENLYDALSARQSWLKKQIPS